MSSIITGTGETMELFNSTGKQAPQTTTELKNHLEEKVELWEIIENKSGE